MKSMDLTVGDALYLYTICPNLPDSSDFFPYKEALFLWFCIEPPRHAWRRPAIQQLQSRIIIRCCTIQWLRRFATVFLLHPLLLLDPLILSKYNRKNERNNGNNRTRNCCNLSRK
jgi:hypothetical protein